MSLSLDLVTLSQTARGDVIEVLEPLEVGAGNTTTIDEHVWGTNNTSAEEDLLGSVSGRAIGTLEDSFDVNVLSITSVKGLLSGSRDHAVSRLKKELLGMINDSLSSFRIVTESAMRDHVLLDVFNIETVRVVNGRVVLNNSGDLATILFDELGGPVTDSTEALNVEGLAFNALGKATAVDEGLGVEELTDGVVNTEAGGLSAAGNTALGDELASAAALSVDILLTSHVHVGVLDPSHGLLVGAHIGTEAIDLSANEVLFDELHGVLSGDSLDLGLGVLARVNLDTTLGATERNISDSKLEGHEGSKGLDLLKINIGRVASATLDGELVSGVVGSVQKNSN